MNERGHFLSSSLKIRHERQSGAAKNKAFSILPDPKAFRAAGEAHSNAHSSSISYMICSSLLRVDVTLISWSDRISAAVRPAAKES